MTQALRNTCFLMIHSRRPAFTYREISCSEKESDLLDYFRISFRESMDIDPSKYSAEQLKEGITLYSSENSFQSDPILHIKLYHGEQLEELYEILDLVDIRDRSGNRLILSDCLKNAQNSTEIEDVIATFNQTTAYSC